MILLAAPVSAAPQTPSLDPMTRTFAYCAGRLSAQMEFQWLMSDPQSDRTAAQRAAMLSLLEAVVSEAGAREALSLRISAKQAHNALLTRATFGPQTEDAHYARLRAEAEIGNCLSLILS